MLLLLLMYLAPFVAMALYWHAQRGAGDTTGWDALQAIAAGRSAYWRPAAAALLFAAVPVAGSIGLRGGVAFVVGAALAVMAAALAYSASTAVLESATAPAQSQTTNAVWSESFAIVLAPAALATGCVGALAWFFADPAGAVVLAAFAAGSSAGALLVSMTIGMGGSARADGGFADVVWARSADASERSAVTLEPSADTSDRSASTWKRSVVTSATTAAMHSHLSAVAAAMMVASTAEPEGLLSLGGLLAETETLRSELLLLPIAISTLSPLLALLVGPIVSSVLERRGATTLFDVERLAAVLACLMMLALVMASGLAWVVAAAFAAGVAARHLAVVADETPIRSQGASRNGARSLLPALLAAAALACGEQLAGWYGITLAALGMTATFATAAACAIARELIAPTSAQASAQASGGELGVADSTVTVTTTLALLVAMAPVLVAESARRGEAVTLVATAAPALLLGVMLGAVAAANLSPRFVQADNDSDAVRNASRAVALTAAIPALAGMLLGAGAALGVVLGFVAWAAATGPLAGVAAEASAARDRMPRSVMLAWGRTMAIAALVGVPLMK